MTLTHRTQWVFTLEADLLLVARGSPCPLVHSLVHSAIVAAQHRVQHLVRVVKRIHQGHCLWPGTRGQTGSDVMGRIKYVCTMLEKNEKLMSIKFVFAIFLTLTATLPPEHNYFK